MTSQAIECAIIRTMYKYRHINGVVVIGSILEINFSAMTKLSAEKCFCIISLLIAADQSSNNSNEMSINYFANFSSLGSP